MNQSKIQSWILATRPKTILASIGPVLIGLSIAFYEIHHIDKLIATLTIICAVLLQISTNIANDYLDHIKGVDTAERLGPVRVTGSGLIPLDQMKLALILLLSLSFIFGLYLMFSGGPFIIIIGLLSLYFSYGYTGGPFPLSYNGLGELSAFIFFGLIAVTGTSFLQTHTINYLSLIFGSGVGAISAAILAVNNLRDIVSDTKTNKRTLAVRIGEKNQRRLILSCILFSILIFLWASIYINKYFFLGIFLPIIFKVTWKKIATGRIDSELNNTLANTAKYLFIFSIFTSIILIIST